MESGLPGRFVERMRSFLGNEYGAFLESYGGNRAYGLRFNTLKGSVPRGFAQYGGRFGLSQVSWCPEGWYYDEGTRPGRSPLHEAGVYYIQEPSAMAAVPLLDPRPGDRVLDLCAAPGGKATQAAACLKGEGLLVSNEVHPARAKILSRNVERMGITNAAVLNEDPSRLVGYFPEFFDKIIVDAPCSGEGMFRKDVEARGQWSEENVRLCAGRQQKILDYAAMMLRPGGKLVYSTCTFAPEEDEGGIAVFLNRHPEFQVSGAPEEKRPLGLSGGRMDLACQGWAGGGGKGDGAGQCPETVLHQIPQTCRIWPHLAKGEGHYLALLEKRGRRGQALPAGAPLPASFVGFHAQSRRGRAAAGPGYYRDREGIRAIRGSLGDIFCDGFFPDEEVFGRLVLYKDQVYVFPEGMPSLEGLKVLRPGLHLGTLKKSRMEPSHALALAMRPESAAASVDLGCDAPQTMAYLGGHPLPAGPAVKGWVLVCVDGYSLGWGKASAGTLKNHYPKGLRIPWPPHA